MVDDKGHVTHEVGKEMLLDALKGLFRIVVHLIDDDLLKTQISEIAHCHDGYGNDDQ